MEQQRFDAIVARLEQESARAPRLYQLKVLLLVLVGFGIMGLMLGAASIGLLLLAGLVLVVVLTGGKALILVLKLGKPLVLLAIGLWVMLRLSISALFTRLPRPEGQAIGPGDAPPLFKALEDMRGRMHGPRFHHVLVTGEMNAGVVQYPLLGLFGWHRNYLILGLPLLESLSPQEALAVVAHEYGHLSGAHGRFGAFVYRLRNSWGTMQTLAHEWKGLGGQAMRRLIDWYAPYFNAYTFVLARANEYEADAASAELVGAGVAASALKRSGILGLQYGEFMDRAIDDVRTRAEPPGDIAQRWARSAREAAPATQALAWLQRELKAAPRPMDTHPALSQRLAALPGQGSAREELPEPLQGPSAADAWFGARADVLRQRLQKQWREQVGAAWTDQHQLWQQRRARRDELQALAERDLDQQVELLQLHQQLDPQGDHLPGIAAFNAAHADHAWGLFLEGSLRLERDDETGLALLDRVMALDPSGIKAACERAYGFLQLRSDARAQAYADRWNERHQWEMQRQHELDTVDVKHELRDHDLTDEQLATARQILAQHGRNIQRAWLVRRVLPSDPEARTYLLVLQLGFVGRYRNRQGNKIVEPLAKCPWPIELFVGTADTAFKALMPRVKALPRSQVL